MKKIIVMFHLLLFLYSYSQEVQEYDNRLYSYTIKDLYFYKYDSDFQIKAVKKIEEIKTDFPEQLIQSIFSCSSEQWEVFNTLGGEKKANIRDQGYYNKIQNMNIDKNYFILKHKLEFEIDKIPTAIIKFYFITEDTSYPQAGIITMQKYENRWYKTSMKMIANLSMTALRLKTEELEKIILGKTETNELKEINQKVSVDGILDFNKLNQEIDSWYESDTKKNKVKIQYFKDPYSIL